MWIADAARSQELDREAVALGISIADLMEQAGRELLREVEALRPPPAKLAILCGRGNNGGDGLVLARLAHAKGYEVACLVLASEAELRQEPAARAAEARPAGVEVQFCPDLQLQGLPEPDVAVDALLGTASKGPVEGLFQQGVEWLNGLTAPVVATDIPTGIDCDTGKASGSYVNAACTVTFGLPKPFLFQNEGLEASGQWRVASLGLPEAILAQPTRARLLEAQHVGRHFPRRSKGAHKGTSGRVLIVAGSRNMPGAAVLAVRGALRAGAGLVKLAAPREVCVVLSHHLPEALLHPLGEGDNLRDLIELQSWCEAAVFGPGMADDAERLYVEGWMTWTKPCCVDADMLTVVAREKGMPACPKVMTPHPGEMARLLGCQTADVEADRWGAVSEGLRQYGGTILLKGAHSVVASPDEPLAVNSTGNPGMATGGMGDVLSGVVATLLAQALAPHDAAALAMYWHGLAADLCARDIGPAGFTASEVADALPKARATILMSCAA